MHLSGLIIGLALSMIAAISPLRAEDAVNMPVFVVSYFEVAPSAVRDTVALARQYADATRKEDGNAGFDAFEEIGRPGRFAMVEAWHDKKTADAHMAAAPTAAFRDKLKPWLVAPLDLRPSSGLSVAAPAGSPGPDAVFVLTHVDVVPTGKDQAIGLVKELADASRKDAGNFRFDVLQQDSRPNHFTLVEGWHDRQAFEGSVTSAHTKEFRQSLTPLAGALYDERLYQAVR